MKKILRKIKSGLKNRIARITINTKKKIEIKKFNDKRRVEIYSKVILTDAPKKSIDDLYLQNYGEKIPYTWHRHFTAFTGRFDEKYFPELLYIPEFEHYMNYNKEYVKVFSDKNMLPLVANSVGVKMPKTLLSATRGAYRDANYSFVSYEEAIRILDNIGEAFAKPSIDSSSGNGCFLINIKNGVDANSGKSSREILNSLGADFCIQTRLTNHESVKALHPDSINTFRVISYRWRNEIVTMPIIMRIGQGKSFLDNAHAGGMFIALDDDGTMHKTAFTEFNTQYVSHPNTGVVFEGYKIDLLPRVITTAKRMHEAIPQIGVVNWDFMLDESGDPVLIEANTISGSVWLIEMAHGVGAFGDRTAEVLRWLQFIKKKPVNDVPKYLFGKTERDI